MYQNGLKLTESTQNENEMRRVEIEKYKDFLILYQKKNQWFKIAKNLPKNELDK